jgi:hypothetical protein
MQRTLALLSLLLAADVAPIAAAPQDAPRSDVAGVAGLSPFGIGSCHANNWSAQANARWMPQMTAIGITNHRTAHTGWGAVQPEPEKWTWEELDRQMSYLEEQHVAFGGIFA